MSKFETLAQQISKIKQLLADDLDSIIFAQISNPLSNQPTNFPITPYHQQMFELFNGARFGIIDIWDYDFLQENQFRVPIDNFDLYEIGQILYNPLFMHKVTQKIYYENNEQLVAFERDIFEFLLDVVLSNNYLSLIDNDTSDEWYQFITKQIF